MTEQTTAPTESAAQNGKAPVTETPKQTAPARRGSRTTKTGNPQTDRAAKTSPKPTTTKATAPKQPAKPAEPKKAAEPKPDIRAGKRDLATRVVLAAGQWSRASAPGGAGSEPSSGGVPCAPPPGGDPAQPRGLRVQRGGEQVVR